MSKLYFLDKSMGGIWIKHRDEYGLYVDGECVGRVKKTNFRIQQLKLRDALQNLAKAIKKAAFHDVKAIRNFIKKWIR